MTTWRMLIDSEVAKRGDRIVAWTLTDEEADAELNNSLDGVVSALTAWGERYVYFPGVFSYEPPGICSVPRNPDGEAVDAYDFDFRGVYD